NPPKGGTTNSSRSFELAISRVHWDKPRQGIPKKPWGTAPGPLPTGRTTDLTGRHAPRLFARLAGWFFFQDFLEGLHSGPAAGAFQGLGGDLFHVAVRLFHLG